MSEVHNPAEHLYARLDAKTGLRVLCSHPACGATLANVVLVPPHVSWNHKTERVVAKDTGEPIRILAMLPGWVRDREGIWHRFRHATQELRRRDRLGEKQRLTRRASKPLPDTSEERRDDEKTGRRLSMIYNYPAHARCPDCSRVHILDAERLRLCDDLADLRWPTALMPYLPSAQR